VALEMRALAPGALVVADNVLIARIEEYLTWVRASTRAGGESDQSSSGEIEALGEPKKKAGVESKGAANPDEREAALFERSTLFKSRIEYCEAGDVEEYGEEAVVDGVEISVWIGGGR
jgi:hypothetical protein